MTHFAFLGTSGAVPSPARDTTSLVFVGPEGAVLVDCGGSPVQKLRLARVNPLAEKRPENPLLTLRELGFSEKDLNLRVPSKFFFDNPYVDELRIAVAEHGWEATANGLTEEENQRLAITYRASEVASLIVTGLSRLTRTT